MARPAGPVVAIVVAAGRGERFGGYKQFVSFGGTSPADLAVAAAATACDSVVVVVPEGASWTGAPVGAVVVGGATRSASVRAGLAAVPDDAEVIVVHDAARPLARPPLFNAVIAAVRAGADGALPAVRLADTIKRVDGERVIETVSRDALVAVQTPQAFRAVALRDAHASGGDAPDDAALVEASGGQVVVVEGDRRNLKITEPDDLPLATALIEEQYR